MDYPGIVACLAQHDGGGAGPGDRASYAYADKGYRTLCALVDGTFKEAA